MRISRRTRLLATLLVLVGILFMQLAVAAYACPGPGRAHMAQASVLSVAGGYEHRGGCDDAPASPSALCQAHCHPDGQSLDRHPLPDVPPFSATLLGATAGMRELMHRAAATEGTDVSFLMHTTAPSTSIRYCCFLI